jgi:hypothetical protein
MSSTTQVETNNIARNEAKFDNTANKLRLTEAGSTYLKLALDPMHDVPLTKLYGYPDSVTTPSIVRCVKQSVNISPQAFQWDAHVIVWPWFQPLLGTEHARINDGLPSVISTVANPLGGVQVFSVPTGTNLSYLTANLAASVALDPAYTQGSGRLLAMGIEVVNTTAPINAQGVVTVWREAQLPPSDFHLRLPSMSYTCRAIRSPPYSTASAMLLPGSRQWKAIDGCYEISTFSTAENPPTAPTYIQPMISINTTDDQESTAGNVAVNNAAVSWLPNSAVVGGGGFMPCLRIHPISMHGAIFAGLSTTTSLTLNVTIYYETFPSPAETAVLSLATPSASYDPVALAIYSRSINELPVGVPATWNPAGEWFANVLDTVSAIAPLVGRLFGPAGTAVGAVSSVAAKQASQYLAPPAAMTVPKVKTQVITRPAKRKKPKKAKAKRAQ